MNLIVVEGKVVRRYKGSKKLASFEFEMGGMNKNSREQHVEFMRVHGFEQYELEDLESEWLRIHEGAAGQAFLRIRNALQDGRIELSRELQ